MIKTILKFNRQSLRLFTLTSVCSCLFATQASAQLSRNPDKFLGNITTGYRVDAGGGVEEYYKLWNQITPENESKWGSVEGTKGSYNWGSDTPFNYAKQYGFTYKFHALVWGAQYPNWFSNKMSIKDRYNAIVSWFDAVKKHYPTLPLIDVVNEAVGMHQQGNPLMKESLGGGGRTGYDWLIKAFELAHERWPDAILIYNDYNTFQSDTENYIQLVKTLRDAGAPIDAYGCQSHDVNDISKDNLSNTMNRIQENLKMPMYITELDINVADDERQKAQYESIFPLMWEADYCAGVTIWGYIYGSTWVDHSGIIRNGQDRPAMTWLRTYMQSDNAKNAKSPYPGMKKEASIYVHPASMKVADGDVLPIKVRASMATKTIEKVELYVGKELIATLTEAPYETVYTTTSTGQKSLKAVVTTTDGTTYERYSNFEVISSTTIREPYSEVIPQLPGTIVMSEFDKGASGISYSNASRNLTATRDGAWMEYTVDVKEDGIYSFDAEIASTKTGGVFHLAEYSMDNLIFFSDFVEVPLTGGNNNFKIMRGLLKVPLTAGRHVLCFCVDKGGFLIKNMSFSRFEEDKNTTVSIYSLKPANISVGDSTKVTLRVKPGKDTEVDYIKIYVNDMYYTTITEEPASQSGYLVYTFYFAPSKGGNQTITAIATTKAGKSKLSSSKTINVSYTRKPYKEIIIPGTFEAEDFDIGGENISFHDSDYDDEGYVQYRSDNEGVDIVSVNDAYAIGYTTIGEWLEYTANVTEAGDYTYEIYASADVMGSSFSLSLNNNGTLTDLTGKISVPQNEDWSKITGRFNEPLNEGTNVIRLSITGNNCIIDKIVFKKIRHNNDIKATFTADPATVINKKPTTLRVTVLPEDLKIDNVKIFKGKNLYKEFTEAPYETEFTPNVSGTYEFTAIVTDSEGAESDVLSCTVKSVSKRSTYGKSAISIPGIIEAENFDKGGDGLTFHDADAEDHGNANYRKDNEGVDIYADNNGYVVGHTSSTDEWLEYTVDVKTAGTYSYSATVKSDEPGSGFKISVLKDDQWVELAQVNVPQSDSGSYTTIQGDLLQELTKGQQIIRISITGPWCYIDKIEIISSDAIRYITPDDIDANGTRYNLGGVRVNEYQRGLIIRNGKTYLIK